MAKLGPFYIRHLARLYRKHSLLFCKNVGGLYLSLELCASGFHIRPQTSQLISSVGRVSELSLSLSPSSMAQIRA